MTKTTFVNVGSKIIVPAKAYPSLRCATQTAAALARRYNRPAKVVGLPKTRKQQLKLKLHHAN
jgi:hypothetical protein